MYKHITNSHDQRRLLLHVFDILHSYSFQILQNIYHTTLSYEIVETQV